MLVRGMSTLAKKSGLGGVLRSSTNPMQHLLQSFFADGMMPPGLLPHVTAVLRSPARPGTALMDLDFVETPDKYRVVCDMPGVKADDIDVFVDDDHVLHIVGHKKAGASMHPEEQEDAETVYHRMERQAEGTLTRLLSLPSDVQLENSSCSFKDAVLAVELPKEPLLAEPRPAHTINVIAAAPDQEPPTRKLEAGTAASATANEPKLKEHKETKETKHAAK